MSPAIDAVKSDVSKKLETNVYRAPRTSLVLKLLEKNLGKIGRSTILSGKHHPTLGTLEEWGFPLSKIFGMLLENTLTDKVNRFVYSGTTPQDHIS